MERHEQVISDFLRFLNRNTSNFILKGGTSLRKCYNLDRFSEDIDLDAVKENIIDAVDVFCKTQGYTYRIVKNTPFVKRCMINYGIDNRPLKVEVSYRRQFIPSEDTTCINNINVYTIDRIAQMKANAYAARDKIRDLYDITFICNHYFDKLSSTTKNIITDAVGNKGIEQFDYLVKTQNDPLIDTNKLETDFLKMFDKLGLLSEPHKLIDLTPDTQKSLHKGRT